MTDFIEITDTNRIRTIRLNRPETKNAINRDMYATMADAINDAQTDNSIRAVSITGTGDAFTSGNDLIDFMQNPPGSETDGSTPPVQRYLSALVDAEKPLVGVVNGVAVGIGLTLLLHCDFVLAARSAVISAPFVDLGVVPEAASSLLLPALVGPRRANEILMLGAKLTAEEAENCGLITRAVDDNLLQKEAQTLLSAIAAKPPAAMRHAKALIRGNKDLIRERMTQESKYFTDALRGPEFAEAAAAFMQKRAANFDDFA